MSWNKTTAVNHAKSHAGSHSQGRCAEFTRKAIQSGGISLGNTYHAKDYGPLLKNAGFSPIGTFEQPRAGDVVVIQPYEGGNPSGHMAIFDGQAWYSDFRQRDMWAGPGYRAGLAPIFPYTF
ncbi:NlpC/P60 family protein, partial [Citrobacter freundii]|uniref:CHAP domain-containing protein n=1 Tax=Citrobacter freundii TaxID=546 RepID=UPI0025C97996